MKWQIKIRCPEKTGVRILLALISAWTCLADTSGRLPNILWIVAEDMNPNLGCYGDANATTPRLDRFASGAMRYANCWSTAPVCAPARTALITGVYPASTGAEHMRSLVKLPDFMRLYPQLMREKGYYCVNNSKEDYNLEKPGKVWDESSRRAHYKNRKPGQPFLAVFNIETTHESQIRTRPHTPVHDPAKMRLPAYHPDTPEVRRDWAQYYDKVTDMDAIAGKLLDELDAAGLAGETIVFFYGDNGSGMPRGKRWLYSSGLNVPLIVRIPEQFKHLAPSGYKPGTASERLVGFVDFAPTLLSIAGVQPPSWMQGRAFMGEHTASPNQFLHGFRGRMDERYDLIRSVRSQRYLYVRNYMPHLIYGQHVAYQFETPSTQAWKKLYDDGRLQPPQTFFWEPKPSEELYDLQEDPDEVNNLIPAAKHQSILDELRAEQRRHALKIRDTGLLPEAELHRRFQGMTPYELGHSSAKYPLEKIMEFAEMASGLKPGMLPALRQGMKDSDSGIRYWAVMGCLMRGAAAAGELGSALRGALGDESPSVRIAAATVLGRYGSDKDLSEALAVLRELAPPDTNGIYVSLEALNAIDALGTKAAPLHAFLGAMPRKDPSAGDRLDGNVEKLLKKMLGNLPVSHPN